MIEDAKYNGLWSKVIASTLFKMGVRDICIAPGNRNTPLVISMTSYNGFNCTSHIDERSCAFYGLGLSKITQRPTVIITTSGTATANLYPAIIEANLSQIPLIILTADRPNSLVGTGENQTIQQRDLYGYQVRYFQDLGIPNKNTNTLEGVLKRIYRISMGLNHSMVRENPPGPVHLNAPFNEPLFELKDFDHVSNVESDQNEQIINYPKINYNSIKKDYSFIYKSQKPLVVCGRMNRVYNEIIDFADSINAPILADPLSQVRYNIKHANIISNYDDFLNSNTIEPDFIIRFGDKPISKKLCSLLTEWDHFTLLFSPNGRFNDSASNILSGDLKHNLELIKTALSPNQFNEKWKDHVLKLDNESEKSLSEKYHSSSLNGAQVAIECIDSLSSGDTFFIGNSLPIRELDIYTSNTDKKILTLANRGASGIDGIISTALGSSTKCKSNTLLLIGDLSFYHDMNGLLAANRYSLDITIVIGNNNGGGIFKKLSLDKNNKSFNEFWETPTNLDFEKVADLYNFNFYRSKTRQDFSKKLKECLLRKGCNIIEAIIQ
tara:strand:+ start:8391 stop:10043 length:1653 start_codon:yes stop_codon:yes gene_type:complete